MRGILMIEPLYHQTIRGNKTQTRRSSGLEQVNGAPEVKKNGKVVKPAIVTNPDEWTFNGFFEDIKDVVIEYVKGSSMTSFSALFINSVRTKVWCKPCYKVGEVLYLKEPTSKTLYKALNEPETKFRRLYKYDNNIEGNVEWANKMFMPLSSAREFIRITVIRCERLLDISDADCIAEGIEHDTMFGQSGEWKNYLYPQEGKFVTDENGKVQFKQTKRNANWRLTSACKTPKESFISLYKFANKVKEVENIFVWVYEFEYLPNYKM